MPLQQLRPRSYLTVLHLAGHATRRRNSVAEMAGFGPESTAIAFLTGRLSTFLTVPQSFKFGPVPFKSGMSYAGLVISIYRIKDACEEMKMTFPNNQAGDSIQSVIR
jgi:hypothetical protein